MSATTLPVGDLTFRKRRQPQDTIRCPLCRRKTPLSWQTRSTIKVVAHGKVVGTLRSVVAECCSTEYVLESE